ncbi:MAG: hypothetical protein ACJ8AW_37105 [Rhodopila sp.]
MAKKALFLEKNMMAPPAPAASQQTTAEAGPKKQAKDYGEPLNFRVPEEFGQQFRMVALRQKMKLQQLLKECFEVYVREKGIDL